MATPEAKPLAGEMRTVNVAAPAAAPSSGEILKLADNRVGVVQGLDLSGVASGDMIAVAVEGPFRIKKASGKTFTAGDLCYWDVSANTALPTGDGGLAAGDPALGTVLVAAGSSQLFVDVDLNAIKGTVST